MTRTARPCPTPRCPKLQPCPRDGHERIPYSNTRRATAPPVTTRSCPQPRCSSTLPCAKHERKPFEGAHRTGGSLYKTAEWRRESRAFRAANPYCVADGGACTRRSSIVDHRIPHRGDEALFWDASNWQAMCHRHHNAKTGRETQQRMRERRLAAAQVAHDGS